jgi:hypothetical protein
VSPSHSCQRPQTDLVREPTIDYFRKPPVDPVALLRQQIDNGTATLTYEPEQGYLRSVMRALHLEADSQVLVYSKTSVQAVRINPKNPRGIYFGDAVTLGYIRGADYLEFAAQDPQQGTIFYTLDQKPSDRPLIQRRDFCLSCHISVATLEVPGLLVRSIPTSPTGSTLPQLGNAVVDHRTPFAERWGGYYVTGRHGSIEHLGNALVDRNDPQASHATAQKRDVAARSVRRRRLPFSARRHCGAAGLRPSDANDQSADPGRLGRPRRRGEAAGRNRIEPRIGRRDCRLHAVRGRGATDVENRGVVRLCAAIFVNRSTRSQRPFAARAGARHPVAALSLQLHDLLGRVRAAAGGDPRRRLSAARRRPYRQAARREVPASVCVRPAGGAGNPPRHETDWRF